ncbi:hypothetical protein JCGZ_15992 [Jatropha curcas]|uniref:Uncharacterized protein n=1 Tax=Jatropha curcas TaxID=180498 RepID=A0A067LAQ4_JATCU|nr:hypothetical protein JCGZ_15992 [Jatropha curcas]
MNQIKAHNSKGNVPFSWEKKPGVSKVNAMINNNQEQDQIVVKLPPPPCPIESPRVSAHEISIPLPPCTFQPPSRSSSRKWDDPFLAAYKECTKSSTRSKAKVAGGSAGFSRSGLRKGMFKLSCKSSCSVRDDNLVRVSQLPYETDRKRDQKCSPV